jgi:predicted MFS family arabinose efflux permease
VSGARPERAAASFPYAGFLVLASVIVLAVTAEGLPTGLLPEMSASLGVPRPGLSVSVAAMGLLASVPRSEWIALPARFLWSMAFGVLPTLMQTLLLRESSSAFRDTGNAVYTATFNIGIGGGALVGALLYSAVGVGSLPWVGVGMLALSAVLVVAASSRLPTTQPVAAS